MKYHHDEKIYTWFNEMHFLHEFDINLLHHDFNTKKKILIAYSFYVWVLLPDIMHLCMNTGFNAQVD